MGLRVRPVASVALVAAVALATALAGCAPPWTGARPGVSRPRATPTVPARAAAAPTRLAVFYGDSLGFEIRDRLVADAAVAGVHLEVRAFGGLALCDLLPNLRSDLTRLHPQVVVLEFVGNSFTPCMRDGSGRLLQVGTAAYDARWRTDLATAVGLADAAGARLVWASAPLTRSSALVANLRRLGTMARAVTASSPNAWVAPTGDVVLDHGAFATRLPCLPDEGPAQGCAGGRIAVRAPDGTHFCPLDPHAVSGVVGDCPVYASGARRFAAAIAGVLPVRRATG